MSYDGLSDKIIYLGIYNVRNQNLISEGQQSNRLQSENEKKLYDSHLIQLINSGHIDKNVNYKKIYKKENLHYYIQIVDNIIFCIIYTGEILRRAMNCMTELMERYEQIVSIYGDTTNELKTDLIKLITYHNDPKTDIFQDVKNKVDEVTEGMKNNIEVVLKRGENIKEINEKANLLENHAYNFDNEAKRVKKKVCMDNVKTTSILTLIILFVIVLFVLLIYGIYEMLTL